jgi:hypothetical protein
MLYTVHLKSQTDDHRREVTVDAESPAMAKAIARRQEAKYVAYSLLPSEPTEPEAPSEDADSTVWDAYAADRSRFEQAQAGYAEALPRSQEKLAALEARYTFDGSGKVVERDDAGSGAAPKSARARGQLHVHYQEKPYRIVRVEPVVPNPLTTVQALAALQQDEGAWQRTLDLIREQGIPLGAVTAAMSGPSWLAQIAGTSPWVWSSASIQISLHTGYTFDPDTHDFFNDASASEITGTGYTANGVTLSGKASTYDTATDQVRLDASDVSWTTSTLSATDAVIWNNTGGASSTDPILGAIDFGATVATTAGTFAITFDATGIFVFDLT